MQKSRVVFSILFVCSIILVLCYSVYPNAAGLKPVAVKTDVMKGTIEKNSLAYVDPHIAKKVGSIVSYKDGSKECISRIVDVSETEIYILGDNEDANDVKEIDIDDIDGGVVYSIPFLGYFDEISTMVLPVMILLILISIGAHFNFFRKMGEE